MTIKDWTTSYSGANPTQDADPITGVQPDLADETAPGAGDGDEARSSHVEKLRDKAQTNAKITGDSANAPVGSLCEILDRDHTNGHARQIRMLERASKPSALGVANCGFTYVKDDGGDTELYYEDDDGAEAQLTADGKSIAETIKESGGTLLTAGAIADGQLIARSGTTFVGQTKRNLSASAAPTANDDSSAGYSVGSQWFDTANDKAYWCVDASVGAAVWTEGGGGGGGTVFAGAWKYLTTSNVPTGAAAPEAVWQFDKTASSLNDRTANGHNLTVSGGTARYSAVAGLLGLASDGTFRLYDGASPAGLRATGAITLEALVAMNDGVTQEILMCTGAGATEVENDLYYLAVSAGSGDALYYSHEYSAGSPQVETFDAMSPPDLHHLTLTRSSDGLTVKVYCDGKLVDSATLANAPTGGGNSVFKIFGNTANNFSGVMCGARVTKEEWNAAQVLEAYENLRVDTLDISTLWRYLDATNLPTGAASPEAVWQFDGTASELDDRTANGHDLTVEGGSELHTAAEGLVGFVSIDSFRLYDGASPAGLRTTGAVTMEFLVSLNNLPSVLSVLFGVYGTDETEAMNNNYAITARNTGIFRAIHEYSTGSDETCDFSAMPVFGPIQHVAITRSSNGLTYKLYIDGQLVDTQTVTNAPTGGGSATPRLLGTSANYFNGAMFCARITKEEWSAAQVLESYQYCRRLS